MAGERILIVDDEESIRTFLQKVCVREHYQVSTAADLRSAQESLADGPYNLVILDLSLPDGSGLEVLRQAKAVHPESEVIILTGYGDLESAVESLRLGAYDYLQKPVFDLQLILRSVSRALERQRLTRHNAQLVWDLQAANAEVEHRRRQQLLNISYIGQALSGALRAEQVAELLISALLNLTACDGIGVLLLHRDGRRSPWALVGGRKNLSPQVQESLVSAMVQHLAERSPAVPGIPDPLAEPCALPGVTNATPLGEQLEVRSLPGLEPDERDEDPWRRVEYGLMAVRDDLKGIVALAGHGDEPFGEEALGILGILANQGSVALDNAYLFARTRELAARDSLTEVYNRRHFFEVLDAEISRSERHHMELSVIMVDLDKGEDRGLKVINDTYGHQAGDEMIRMAARFLQDNVRRADVVARYGGDEFIILAPQTGKPEVLALATRLCEQLAAAPFSVAGRPLHITASIGVSVYLPGNGHSADRLVALADRGLYLAKEGGGNQVCMVDEPIEGADKP